MLKSGNALPLIQVSQKPMQVITMKIESSTSSAIGLGKTRQARPATTGAPSTSAPAGEAVSLSPVSGAEGAAAPVDAQRVAEIRQAIIDGKLQIEPERIADRLIEGAREQFSKGRGS